MKRAIRSSSIALIVSGSLRISGCMPSQVAIERCRCQLRRSALAVVPWTDNALAPNRRGDRVCHLVGGGAAAEVGGAEFAIAEDAAHGGLDGVRGGGLAEVAEHQGA